MGVESSLIEYDYINEPMDLSDDVAPNMKTTGWGTGDYKGATVVFPREMHNYSGNGWYGKDEPHLATVEWGQEMVQTTADYILVLIEELKKVSL